MKKIAFVLPDLNIIGAQRISVDYGKQLLEIGYEVTWIARSGGPLEYEIGNNIKFFKAGRFEAIPVLRFLMALSNLALHLRDSNYDTIISVTPFFNRVLCLLKAIHVFKSRLVIEDHAYPPHSYKDEFNNRVIRTFYKRSEFLYRYADRFRVLSEKCKIYYDRKLRLNLAIVQPNFLNLKRIELLVSDKGLADDLEKPSIVYIGRFSSQKNIPFLVRAFALLRKTNDIHLKIIGYGSDEEIIKSEIERLNLSEHVSMINNSSENMNHLKSSILFPMVSLWEGMPVVIMEAMMLMVPVVSIDFDTGPEYLIGLNQERGLIVKGYDEKVFSDAMKSIIDNKELYKNKVNIAKNYVSDQFDINNNFYKYVEKFLN